MSEFVFKRELKTKMIEDLKNDKLFKEKILPDIGKDVFPAIRNKRIDFYHYNNRLFSYNGKFTTHPKYAFVPVKYKSGYVTEEDILENENCNKVADFKSGYENIKERAKLYTTVEAKGVYEICKNNNLLNKKDYIVLDIEVNFVRDKENSSVEKITPTIETIDDKRNKKEQDRIDMVLYGIKERKLVFVEVKDITNGELVSEKKPKVVEQIKKYDKDIKKHKEEILPAYKNYIEYLNQLFDLNLPEPEKVCEECKLLIFGYEGRNQGDYLNKKIIPKLIDNISREEEGRRIVKVPKAKEISLEQFFIG